MPVHDWTRVAAGIFHDFHTVWTGALRNVLNEGLLPKRVLRVGGAARRPRNRGRPDTSRWPRSAGPSMAAAGCRRDCRC